MKTTINTTAAQQALDTLKRVTLGEPYRPAFEAATTAARAVCDSARPAIFPGIEPIGADVMADLNLCLDSVPIGPEFSAGLVQLHGEAVTEHPALARAIRSGAMRRRLRADDVGTFERQTSAQLAATGDPAAVAFSEAIAMLSDADAIRADHEAHSQAELERIANEQRAADAAVAAVEQQHRDHLAQFFGARSSVTFQLGGRTFSGGAVAALLNGQMARDTDGYGAVDLNTTNTPSLDAIEKAMRQQLAFEAAA